MTATMSVAPTPSAADRRTVRDWHDEVRRRQAAGDTDGAIQLLRRLADQAPNIVRLRTDLVTLLRAAGRQAEADREAVLLDPDDAGAWTRLTRHARIVGDEVGFIAAAEGWHRAAPADAVAAHFATIARSLRSGTAHERASDRYVRTVFDGYAEHFDEHLGRLGYRGPQVVAELVHDLVDNAVLRADARIADLGCGTGLVGLALRAGDATEDTPWNGSLVGADLSPEMVRRSRERAAGSEPVYDEVIEADFVSFLQRDDAGYDAIVSADSLIYVGDLRPVLAASAATLGTGGWFVVTLEHASCGEAAEHGFRPHMSGRYLHDLEWVDREVRAAGFELVVVDELSVRHEGGQPVPGLVVVARMPD